jgi:hypothetical protein
LKNRLINCIKLRLKANPKAKKIKYKLSWAQDPVYYLNTYITPPAKGPAPNAKGGTINPPPPPNP